MAAKLKFRSVPVRDFDAADFRRKLPECVAALDWMLKAGHTVYLHCTAGQVRSPTVVAAYLHWSGHWRTSARPATARQTRKPSAAPGGRFDC